MLGKAFGIRLNPHRWSKLGNFVQMPCFVAYCCGLLRPSASNASKCKEGIEEVISTIAPFLSVSGGSIELIECLCSSSLRM